MSENRTVTAPRPSVISTSDPSTGNNQEFQRNILEEILTQLKVITAHWEIANQQIIEEDDLK